MGNQHHHAQTSSNQDRVAVVTGGTQGIGLAISKSLLQSGANVLAVYRSNTTAAESAERELKAISPDVEIVQADVGFKEQAEKIAEAAGKRWGRIDILVNNAGDLEFAVLEELSEETLDRVFRTNLKGMIFMTQAALPWMKKHKFGRILNAGSIAAKIGDIGLIPYSCSKVSVNMFTQITAGELAPYGITVNAYAPGIVYTEMTREMIETRGDKQVQQIPVRRFGKSEEVSSLITFLCSDAAAYITGEIIGIDGGMLKVQNPYRAYDYE